MKSVSVKRLLVISSVILFFYGLFLGGLQLVISDIASGFEAGKSGMGMLVSAQHITAAFMPLVIGMVADHIGKKPVLIAFTVIFGSGCLIAGISNSIIVYVIGTLLIGCGYSVCESQCCALLTDLNRKKAAQYINITQGVLSVGAIVSPLLLKFVMTSFMMEWRILFYVCAAAFFLISVPLALSAFPVSVSHQNIENRNFNALKLFGYGVFTCLFVSIILYVGLENGFGYFIESHFTERLNSNSGAAAIAIYWAGMAISRFICGTRNWDNRKLLIGCFTASALLFVLLILNRSTAVAMLISALIGAFYAPIWSVLMAEAASRFPEHSGSASGLMSTGCGIGGIVFPSIMGITAQQTNLSAAFVILAGIAFAGGVICFLIPSTKNKEI